MGEEFLLKWNDYHSSFSTMMESLCLTEEMVDCTVSGGSKTFSAHRMILSTCSPYFRSLFSTVPRNQHPVIFVRDVDDGILELLVRYMYSGQVSVTEEQLVPLVQAAKSLNIKGLIDVPVQNSQTSSDHKIRPKSTPSPKQSKKQKTKCEPVKSESGEVTDGPSPPNRIGEVDVFPTASPPVEKVEATNNGPPLVDLDGEIGDNSYDELDTSVEEGVDPISTDMDQSHLLQRLTSEMTAFPFSGGGIESGPPQLQIYSCEHCGKEFTSKRKHQRHVLNVHFGYNPVQCPFCNKGHRDNYNLKQHVCPVLNMKYGVFEKKEVEAGGSIGHAIEAQQSNILLKNALGLSMAKKDS